MVVCRIAHNLNLAIDRQILNALDFGARHRLLTY
jgi:hypothetical protein